MSHLERDSRALTDFLAAHPRLLVLTGAGISAASGIPTYRDHAGTWQTRKPIDHRDFQRDAGTRQRYWSRSFYGWPLIRDAQPNAAHSALAQLEARGSIDLLITQNVDRLHQRAGSQRVVDLHGRVDRVRCLQCAHLHSRDSVQQQLGSSNHWPQQATGSARPDGDMEIATAAVASIVLPKCTRCDGELMPDVVFFGGNVPLPRVHTCLDALDAADALLVIGSSLTVYSGFRFCRRSAQLGKPLAIINPGSTRADPLATLRLHSDAAPLLSAALDQLQP